MNSVYCKKHVVAAIVLLVILIYFIVTDLTPNRHAYTSQIYYKIYPRESIACYRIKNESIPDISETKPKKGKSIFFHETTCESYWSGKIVINARQACAVESAAKLNSDYDVYLLYSSPGKFKFEETESDRYLLALLNNYKNIKIKHIDFETYARGTPVQDLYDKGILEKSSYANIHASDVVRLLTLWKYGGIYLDLDVIVIKSLESLSSNFAGSESATNVANGVMGFSHTGIGHDLVKDCLNDLKNDFRGSEWGYNGPGLITRMLKKICNTQNVKDMLKKDCQGVTVYPPETFYPIRWRNWSMYFEEKYTDDVIKLSEKSYIIHVWNFLSKKTKLHIHSKAPYAFFARRYCPKVFQECKEFF